MSKTYNIYIWKKATFLRLLLPVIAGIVLQFFIGFQVQTILIAATILAVLFVTFSLLPLVHRFKHHSIVGIIITLFMVVMGFFVIYQKDVRHQHNWYGNFYDSSSYFVATILEPPVEKNKSFKAIGNRIGISPFENAMSFPKNLTRNVEIFWNVRGISSLA